jgi:hypothetical protein
MIDQILTTLVWFLGIGVLIMVSWFVYDEMQYKHKAIVKQNDHGMNLTKIVKLKEERDKDGSLWWKLKGYKEKIPRPPNQCILIDNKGRFLSQFFELDGGELKPMIDKGSKEILDLQAVTVSQRQIIVNQILKVQRQKGKSWVDLAYYAVPILAVVMIIAIFMIFFGEAVEPMVNLGNTNTELLSQANRILQRAEDLSCGRRSLVDYEITGGTATPVIPPN